MNKIPVFAIMSAVRYFWLVPLVIACVFVASTAVTSGERARGKRGEEQRRETEERNAFKVGLEVDRFVADTLRRIPPRTTLHITIGADGPIVFATCDGEGAKDAEDYCKAWASTLADAGWECEETSDGVWECDKIEVEEE